MAETGQIKLYGDHPTLTETALARARRNCKSEKEKKKEEEIATIRLIINSTKEKITNTGKTASRLIFLFSCPALTK
ncbi:unnamed protein product [Spirodela intermedia]|uniref:Uncharacterized protein n=1 Tax=Spirodela intermedia TaxID=51605 RepID=A0A7I8KMA2_SPIIN|nr:unnamed protein product [Spirodela intermedia]